MKHAMYSIALKACYTGVKVVFILLCLALTGCALPSPPTRPAIYDFGPGPLSTPAAPRLANLPPLAVADIDANPALDSTALLYRLAYDNAQQLKPYALARWSMTPAQLLRKRLREQLAQRRAQLNPGEGGLVGAGAPLTLRIELEEFSHLFETPLKSMGLLRLRATLVQPSPSGEKLVAQRSLITQRPAPSADAGGGVRALTAATDVAVQELEEWLGQLGR